MVSQNPRRSGNPAIRASTPQASSPSKAGSTAARMAVAQRSQGLLVYMARLPPIMVPGLMLVLMMTGLLAPLPYALVALAVILVFVGWLAYISWPVLDTKGKLTRGLMLGVVLGSALGRIKGWL